MSMDKIRILVVDDEPVNIKLVQAHLSGLGYEVIIARDGEEALEKISSNKIDLILLDVMLPGINGFDVCIQIREKYKQTTPIILLTTLSDVRTKADAFGWGADDFLTKPFNKDELLTRIRLHLKIKIMVDEIRELKTMLEEK